MDKASALLSSAAFIPQDGDSIERLTVLGAQLTNAYLIPNMTQAYHNLGIYNVPVVVTNLYVRFKPTIAQLSILDSTMDAQGLEIFDTPIDYDVTYEGDYYQDPSIPDSMVTWQYAVVPPNFVFPSGITYEILAQIHIPGDSYTAVETEAENLAAGSGPSRPNIQPDVPQCDVDYHWDYSLNRCVPNNCQPGYHWDASLQRCIIDPNTFPPPAGDAAVPAGIIRVHDTNLNTDVGVRKARVVARRWFKVERVFTDDNGNFVFSKKFKHKVRILVKFKNTDAQVRNVRGVRFWQMLFPVKATLGIFSGTKNAIPPFVFNQFTDYSAKGNIYWTAATVHNSVQEYRDYSTLNQIGLPPQGLKIFISKSGAIGNGGATPMWAKRFINNISTQFGLTYISNSPVIAAIIAVVKSQMDMIIGYRYTNQSGNRDITQLLSDRMKEDTYHELTHAAHYTALGNSWYTSFVTAEEFEIVSNFTSGFSPYGNGANSYSPIIALGEGWAYYMGHFLADRTYGLNSSQSNEQGIGYVNNSPLPGLSSHLNLLEDFSPYRLPDHFHWIPQGLFRDLNDTRNEQRATGGPVDDNVTNYTNQQMFNAFRSSIYTLQDYRIKLIQQNPTNPTTPQVTNLFFQYGY